MPDWLKKWGGIAGAMLAILSLMGAAGAYADKVIDGRVEIRLAAAFNEQLQPLARQLNGVQEQVNAGSNDNKVIKEKLQHIERQQDEKARSLEKQLDLIIKMIEQRQ